MSGFSNAFGGGVLQPTSVSEQSVALSGNLSWVWPLNSVTGADFIAAINDITPSAAGFSIAMPPANQVSTGQPVTFTNKGAYSFNVTDNTGTVLATVTPGQAVIFYIYNNATIAGSWYSLLLGVGSANLSAATIAGAGLAAIGSVLVQTTLVQAISTSYSLQASDRATAIIWTGGAGTLTLLPEGTAGNGFFFEARNQGSGALTVAAQASELIDGASNIVLQPGDSGFIHAGTASNWYSVGRGRNQQFNFTELVQAVTGGTTTLTNVQASNVVQKYTGTLTSNATIVVPAVVQVYYVQNATSGAFSMTFQSPTPGSTVVVPQGQNAVLFSDGVNLVNASTTVSGISSLILSQGSAASPSISFTGNTNTGIFQPASNQVGISAAGSQVAAFNSSGLVLTGALSAGTTVSANVTVTAGTDTAAGNLITDGPAGSYRELLFKTASVNRWLVAADGTAETGSNAGSNLGINCYSDTGAYLNTPFQITRANSAITLSGPTTVNNTLIVTGGINNSAGALSSGAITTTGQLVSNYASAAPQLILNNTNPYQYMIEPQQSGTPRGYWGADANYCFRVANNTGTIAALLLDNTGSQINAGTFQSGSTATPGLFIATGAAATNRGSYIETSGTQRWFFGGDPSAESGSNTGTNFGINSYTDAGAYLATPLTINRASGLTTLAALTVTGAITPSQTAGIVGTTTNNAANAGSVGEIITATGTSVSLNSGTSKTITSVSLTAGDWEISASIEFSFNSNTTSTGGFFAGINTTTNVLPSTIPQVTQQSALVINTVGPTKYALVVQSQPLQLGATTTYYLVGNAGFTGTSSAATANGYIYARRVR